MYYSIYYINLDQLFQKVNIPKAISGHMCLIRYQNTCVLIRHFSVAKIPITHCSLYNKLFYFIVIITWCQGTNSATYFRNSGTAHLNKCFCDFGSKGFETLGIPFTSPNVISFSICFLISTSLEGMSVFPFIFIFKVPPTQPLGYCFQLAFYFLLVQ